MLSSFSAFWALLWAWLLVCSSLCVSGSAQSFSSPVPSVTSISGCVGSGLSTVGCLTSSSLTFTGSSFDVFNSSNAVRLFDVFLGASEPYTRLPKQSVALLDSTHLVITPSYVANWADILSLFGNGQTQLVRLVSRSDGWAILAGNVSFSGYPAPVVDSVHGCGGFNNGSSVLQDCQAGQDVITFLGQWLLPNITVTLSAVSATGRVLSSLACADYSGYDVYYQSYQCVLPFIGSPDAATDHFTLALANDLGPATSTLSTVVTFTTQPVISYVQPCLDSASPWLPNSAFDYPWKCQPGQLVTIEGENFPTSPLAAQPTVVITPGGGGSPPFECDRLTVVSSSELTCALPRLNASALAYVMAGRSTVTMVVNGSTTGTALLNMFPYDWPNSPVVQSVSSPGCTSVLSSPLQLTDCQPGAVLTLSGLSLTSSADSDLTVRTKAVPWQEAAPYSCYNATETNDSLTCTLDSLVQADDTATHPFIVSLTRQARPMSSNVFYVQFAPPPSSTGGGGGGNAAARENGVSPVTAVVVVAAALLAAMIA